MSVKQRILDAALDIVKEHGVKALTQTRVAAAAGLRQSHLTYYFPHKADLLAAALQASHARASDAKAKRSEAVDAMAAIESLIVDRNKMRFFLGVVLEASERPDLRKTLHAHAGGIGEQIGPLFGRAADDPDIVAFIDMLRGMGMRMLLEPEQKRRKKIDLDALAARLGLFRR